MPTLVIILLVVLILVALAALPTYPYSRAWGYYPTVILAAIAIIILLLWLFGVLDF